MNGRGSPRGAHTDGLTATTTIPHATLELEALASLAAAHGGGGMTTTYEYRVSWRRPSWLPSTKTKSRTFGRERDAQRFVAKVAGDGRPDLAPAEITVARRPVGSGENEHHPRRLVTLALRARLGRPPRAVDPPGPPVALVHDQ